MCRISDIWVGWLLFSFVVFAGCSGDQSAPALANKGPANTTALVSSTDAGSNQSAPVGGVENSAPIPPTADLALRAVLEGLHDDRPDAVWDALPASYQQDINDVVHLFARRMHPEAWKWFLQISRKGAVVLRLPRDTEEDTSVADTAMPDGDDEAPDARSSSGDATEIEQVSGKDRLASSKSDNPRLHHLLGRDQNRAAERQESRADRERREAIAKLLDRVADTGPAGQEMLKKVDVGSLLRREESRTLLEAFHAAIGAAMGTADVQDFFVLVDYDPSELRFSVGQSTADTAIVEIVFPNDGPGEIECVRIDGKWVPRPLADTWAETMSNLKRGILEALPSETATENFGPVFQYLGMIELSFDGELAHARQDAEGDAAPANIQRAVLLDAPMMVLEFLIAGPYEPEQRDSMTDVDGILMDLPRGSEMGGDDDNARADVSLFEQIAGKSLSAEGKRVAVLCIPGTDVHAGHPALAATVSDELSRRLKVGNINVVEAEKIATWIKDHAQFTADSDLTDLATEHDVGYIVQFHIDSLGFSEENFPELRRGRAQGRVVVVEITAGDDGQKNSRVIFKQPFESKYPQDAPIAADAEEAEAFKERYLGRLHFELSRLFLVSP